MLENIPEKICDSKEVAKETATDPVLAQILQWVRRGWPTENGGFSAEYLPYLQRKN